MVYNLHCALQTTQIQIRGCRARSPLRTYRHEISPRRGWINFEMLWRQLKDMRSALPLFACCVLAGCRLADLNPSRMEFVSRTTSVAQLRTLLSPNFVNLA